jgi:hypothetical protein
MKYKISKIMVAAIFAATVSVQANARTHSKSIVVESPSDLPEMAQRNSKAMYLHETGGGQTVLYLEQDQGRTLGILDVTDPGAIRAIARVSIPATSPYDFVGALNDSAVLIYYRDHSGFAVINLKKYKHPVLAEAPQFQHPAQAEPFGQNGLLLTSSARPIYQSEDPQYQLIDVSNPSKPTVLANVEGVQQRLERTETGTTFLLANTGLTVIRRLNAEEEYRIEQWQKEGN